MLPRRPAAVDLIIRAAQDRALAEATSLFANAAAWPELTQMRVKVSPRRAGDHGRIATVALRAGPVTLKRPRLGFAKNDPETVWRFVRGFSRTARNAEVSMTLAEAREINPLPNQKLLHWRRLTTIAVDDADAAQEIVRWYRLRWRIEEMFRAGQAGSRFGRL